MPLVRGLGCLAVLVGTACHNGPPDTVGDPKNAPNYGYNPIDPLPVTVKVDAGLPDPPSSACFLDMLSDETVRMAIGSVDAQGNISYGPAKLGVAHSSYVVVLDYSLSKTQPFNVGVDNAPSGMVVTAAAAGPLPAGPYKQVSTVPVYLGAGLRMTASLTVNSGNVDLANLLAVGVAGQAKQVTGTMVVQTMGISGPSVATLLPLPSDINTSSIQAALVALGAIKAKIYDAGTTVVPRTIGFYNTLGGGQATVNAFISQVLTKPVDFAVTKSKNCTSATPP